MWPMLINQWYRKIRTIFQLLQGLLPGERRGVSPCAAERKTIEVRNVFFSNIFKMCSCYYTTSQTALMCLSGLVQGGGVPRVPMRHKKNKQKCSPWGVQSDADFYLQSNSWKSHSTCSWLNWSLMVAIKQRTLSNTGLSYLEGHTQEGLRSRELLSTNSQH